MKLKLKKIYKKELIEIIKKLLKKYYKYIKLFIKKKILNFNVPARI
jgi:hypothetical protein